MVVHEVAPRATEIAISGTRPLVRSTAMEITRIYTGTDGHSHFEDLVADLNDLGPMGLISDTIPTSGVQFREVSGEYHLDFHRAPRRQYVVNLTGSVEIEVGDGTKRIMGPGTILLAEDTTGQGHISRNVNGEARTCMFIHLDALATPGQPA